MEKELVTRLDGLGMTREDLARSLGVSLSSVYHWRQIPKYVTAYLSSREREHERGMAVSGVSDGVGSVREVVPMPSDAGGDAAVAGDAVPKGSDGANGGGNRPAPTNPAIESGRRRR